MHLIALSIDRSIFKENSAVRARMEQYGTLVNGMDIIALGAEKQAHMQPVKLKNNVMVHAAPGNKLASVFAALQIAKKIARPDTVIISQDPFELGLVGLIISWITSRPLHVQVHIDFFNPFFRQESIRQRFQAMLAPFVLSRAKSIRVVSGKIGYYLRNELGISAKKITIAPVFIDLEIIKNKPVTIHLHTRFPEFEWIVLAPSRYVKQKNLPLAIDAFQLFLKSHPKAGLVIAGAGPEEENLKKIVAEKGLFRSVKIGSWTDQFASCMKTCDAFLLSSDYEGWGMTVIEAASLGKPVVMTDIGCAGEFLIDKKNGLVVPARDPQAIANGLEAYYSDRVFAENMAKAAQNDAGTHMTLSEYDTLMKKSWESALQ